MESIEFENKKGYKIAGKIERSKTAHNGQYIVFVHGFTGDKDEKGLFSEAAKYFSNVGFSVFRFDMTGCGESEGEFQEVSLDDQKNDLLGAIEFIKEKESIQNEDIIILAFSLGATVSILVYDYISDIKGMSFWSPAFFPERDIFPRFQTSEIKLEFDTKGYFIKSGIKVGKKIVNDLGATNLAPLLGKIQSPVLLVHGKEDTKISSNSTRIGTKLFNGSSCGFVEIPRADHSFRSPPNARTIVMEETNKFFKLL